MRCGCHGEMRRSRRRDWRNVNVMDPGGPRWRRGKTRGTGVRRRWGGVDMRTIHAASGACCGEREEEGVDGGGTGTERRRDGQGGERAIDRESETPPRHKTGGVACCMVVERRRTGYK